jgi:hypothetical protein
MTPTPVAEVIPHTTTSDQSRPDAVSRDLSRQIDETVQHLNMPGISERERELYEQLLATYKDQIQDLMNDKTLL